MNPNGLAAHNRNISQSIEVHQQSKVDEQAMSPLTFSDISVTSEGRVDAAVANNPILQHDRILSFSIGITHTVAASTKAPRNSSHFESINFYQSNAIFDSYLVLQLNNFNTKRMEKFFSGIDVVYKVKEKVFICQPLLCPAKIYYEVEQESQCEVIVGIFVDQRGVTHPITAVYNSSHQLKSFTKQKISIHSLFKRYQPTKIAHDFQLGDMAHFSKELYKFLNIKSPLNEAEGSKILIF